MQDPSPSAHKYARTRLCVCDLFYYKFLQFTISFWVYTINMQVNNSKKAIPDPSKQRSLLKSASQCSMHLLFVQWCSNPDSPVKTGDYQQQNHNITKLKGTECRWNKSSPFKDRHIKVRFLPPRSLTFAPK